MYYDSLHVLAGRTAVLDVSRYMGTNAHKQSQPLQRNPASSQHAELLRDYVRLVLRNDVTVTYEN